MTVHEYERYRFERAFQAKISELITLGIKINFVLLFVFGVFTRLKSEALSDKTYIYALVYNIASILLFLGAAGPDQNLRARDYFIWVGSASLGSVFTTYLLQSWPGNNEFVIAIVWVVVAFIILTWFKKHHLTSLENIEQNDAMVAVNIAMVENLNQPVGAINKNVG